MTIIMGNDGEYGWQSKYYATPPFYNNFYHPPLLTKASL
uniref:Uncharacterized protein n=1 Tax=uncultured bacterium contig00032 TaxID=1181521 RepID=A0A806KJP7_9BACT|nr:hypothetical protein [uncultured bacterium contig00032]